MNNEKNYFLLIFPIFIILIILISFITTQMIEAEKEKCRTTTDLRYYGEHRCIKYLESKGE